MNTLYHVNSTFILPNTPGPMAGVDSERWVRRYSLRMRCLSSEPVWGRLDTRFMLSPLSQRSLRLRSGLLPGEAGVRGLRGVGEGEGADGEGAEEEERAITKRKRIKRRRAAWIQGEMFVVDVFIILLLMFS